MFVPARAFQALAQRRDAFHRSAADAADQRSRYEAALDALRALSAAEIEERLGGVPWPGARPTEEFDRRGLIAPFPHVWESAQEARAWALPRIRGVPTIAVDGSQIPASKEFAVPVSLVQVAWFINEHDPNRPYIKDVRNEIVTPDEDEPDYLSFAESRVGQRRFALEMETAVEQLQRLASVPSIPRPPSPGLGERGEALLFIDGTFVLSFAGRMSPEVRDVYLRALFALLDASERYRIPVIGYVDLSFSADLAAMLRAAFDLSEGRVFDAQILAATMGTFDRTCAFRCARGDVLPYYRTPERDYSRDLYFLYLKTGADRLPARIDVPRWVVEAGLLDHVVDVVRAEIVIGQGYPYALETADAAAVLTGDDRIAFFRLFHEFARESGFDVSLPAKSVSKAHRR